MESDAIFAQAVALIRRAMTEPEAERRQALLEKALQLNQFAYQPAKVGAQASQDQD